MQAVCSVSNAINLRFLRFPHLFPAHSRGRQPRKHFLIYRRRTPPPAFALLFVPCYLSPSGIFLFYYIIYAGCIHNISKKRISSILYLFVMIVSKRHTFWPAGPHLQKGQGWHKCQPWPVLEPWNSDQKAFCLFCNMFCRQAIFLEQFVRVARFPELILNAHRGKFCAGFAHQCL